MSDQPTRLEDFRALLKLQEVDTELDQLRFRRSHLPEHETLAAVSSRAMALRPTLTALVVSRDEIAARLLTIESEVAGIESRVASINLRMYDGSVNLAPSDALALSQEAKHLDERRRSLEDRELEVMEELEPVQNELDGLEAQGHQLAGEMQSVNGLIAAAQSEIDAHIGELERRRVGEAQSVPTSLMAEYDMLRQKLGGTGAAPLLGAACGGCHLALSATEVDNLRKAPPSEVIHCEECGRILVR